MGEFQIVEQLLGLPIDRKTILMMREIIEGQREITDIVILMKINNTKMKSEINFGMIVFRKNP